MSAGDGRLGLGIVGLGTAGAAMLAAALHHDGVRVVAVADPVVDDLPLAELAGVATHRTLDELLEDRAVEAVHLATPTSLHAEHVQAAVAAGRHVIVEKPVTTHSAGVDRLAEAAAAAGVTVLVGHSESFEPYVAAGRAAIAGGRIGQVVAVVAEKVTDWMRRPRRPDELDPGAGGGIVRRQGVHQVDVVRSLVPEAAFVARRARLHLDAQLGVPAGYVAWLDGIAPALLLQDGSGVRVAARPATGTGSAGEPDPEAEKRRRSRVLVERAVTGGGPLALGTTDVERVEVLGTDGRLVGSSAGVLVERGGAVEDLDLGSHPDGRSAVLDELLGVLAGRPALHDLGWGAENLRLCEAIDQMG